MKFYNAKRPISASYKSRRNVFCATDLSTLNDNELEFVLDSLTSCLEAFFIDRLHPEIQDILVSYIPEQNKIEIKFMLQDVFDSNLGEHGEYVDYSEFKSLSKESALYGSKMLDEVKLALHRWVGSSKYPWLRVVSALFHSASTNNGKCWLSIDLIGRN